MSLPSFASLTEYQYGAMVRELELSRKVYDLRLGYREYLAALRALDLTRAENVAAGL